MFSNVSSNNIVQQIEIDPIDTVVSIFMEFVRTGIYGILLDPSDWLIHLRTYDLTYGYLDLSFDSDGFDIFISNHYAHSNTAIIVARKFFEV